jgi:hypothetical protein
MRANSRRVVSSSNQWNACATMTRSTLASGSPLASSLPSMASKCSYACSQRSAAARIGAFGSTAVTR